MYCRALIAAADQEQLVLAVAIVGLAVAAGIETFGRNVEKETFDQMAGEAVKLAGEAMAWRQKPAPMGGGNPLYLEGLSFAERECVAAYFVIREGDRLVDRYASAFKPWLGGVA